MYKADRVSISNSTNCQPLCIPSSSSITFNLQRSWSLYECSQSSWNKFNIWITILPS